MRKSETAKKVAGASDADGYTRLPSCEYNLLEQTKIPIARTTSSRLLPPRKRGILFSRPVASRRLSNSRHFSPSLSPFLSAFLSLARRPPPKPPQSVPLNPIVPRCARFTPLRILYKPEKTRPDADRTLFSIYVYSRGGKKATRLHRREILRCLNQSGIKRIAMLT